MGEIMKLKKPFILTTSIILLTGCGATTSDVSASSSESAASVDSSSVVTLDPIEQFVKDLKGNNLTVVSPSYATIEYYDDYSVYYDYVSEWLTDSGTFYVPNIGYCNIDVDHNVKIDTPSATKGKMSDLYLMPSTIGDLIESIGESAFKDPVDDVYEVNDENLIAYLAVFAGYSSSDAIDFSKATIKQVDTGYEFYVFKDNSSEREAYGLSETDYPDVECTCTISNIGTTVANELADFAETYVPTGLSKGLSDKEKETLKSYQNDDNIVDKIASLNFSSSSFFEDAYDSWHISDYRIGDITEDYKKLLTDNGYKITVDNSEASVGNYTYIFEKATTESDEKTGEEWTGSVSRLTYAYVSHYWFTSEDGMGYPSWSYPDGRVGLAGLNDSYMQPSVCENSWNKQTDVSGTTIPQFSSSVAIDKTKYADEWGSMTFSMHFDEDTSIIIEGKAYDKVLENAGWTGDGWTTYSDYYSESIRKSTPDSDGKYTQISVIATQTELDLSITTIDPNESYDY